MKFSVLVITLVAALHLNTYPLTFSQVTNLIKPVASGIVKTISNYKKTSACVLTVSLLYGFQAFKKSSFYQNPTMKKLRQTLTALRVKTLSCMRMKPSLLDATKKNDESLTKYLLLNGGNINQRNIQGYTPLHFAVRNDNVGIVQDLIAAGANVNASTNFRATVLDSAVVHGNQEIITLLLQKGAQLSALKSCIEYAINKATSKPSYRIILEQLIDAKQLDLNSNICGNYPLVLAIKNKDYQLAELFLTKGADPNANFNEPLIAAIANSDEKALQILIDHKVDLNDWSNPSLNIAARYGNPKILELLVKHEAKFDENKPRQFQESPLFIAAQHDHSDAVEFLLSQGYKSTYKNIFGKTAYDIAQEVGNTKSITIMNRFADEVEPEITRRNSVSSF